MTGFAERALWQLALTMADVPKEHRSSVMGWWAKRRARRAAELAAIIAGAVAPAVSEAVKAQIPSDPLSMIQIVNEISKGRLEVQKSENEFELEKLKMDRELRLEERKAAAEQKAKDKAYREDQARKMRELRAAGRIGPRRIAARGDLDPRVLTCEECLSSFEKRKPRHENDMLRHAQEQHHLLIAGVEIPQAVAK